MDKRLTALIVLCAAATAFALYFAFREPDWQPGGARGNFGQGRRAVTSGEYGKAVPLLERYLKERPGERNAGRSRFFLGKAYLGLGDMEAAEKEFQKTIRDFPGSLEARKSRYKLALISMWKGDTEKARRSFSRIAGKPDSPLAPEAKAMEEYLSSMKNDPPR